MTQKEIVIEIIKILLPAIVGFILGIYGAKIGWNWQVADRNESIAKVIATEIFNEMIITKDVVKGVVKNIEKKHFKLDLGYFLNIYSPRASITEFNDIGFLNTKIVATYISYKQMITTCEQYRQTYIDAVKDNKNNIQISYFTYLIGLDAVMARGKLLLEAILDEYDFPDYKKIPYYEENYQITGLMKYVQESINDERKK